MKGSGDGSSRPARTCFFIAGAGRSGSTYLYYVLKEHPKIAITNESRVLDALQLSFEAATLPFGERSPASGMMGQIRPDAAPTFRDVFVTHGARMLEDFYERTFDRPFTHFGDKLASPDAVAHAVHMLPDVRVIVLVRDPRDVVCSYRALQQVQVDLGPLQDEMRELSVGDLARVWRDTYEVLLDRVPRQHRVRYEDLIKHPFEVVRGILDHLGLDYRPEVERAILQNDTLGGHGTSKSARDSLGRWHVDLTLDEAREVTDICAATMARLGTSE